MSHHNKIASACQLADNVFRGMPSLELFAEYFHLRDRVRGCVCTEKELPSIFVDVFDDLYEDDHLRQPMSSTTALCADCSAKPDNKCYAMPEIKASVFTMTCRNSRVYVAAHEFSCLMPHISLASQLQFIGHSESSFEDLVIADTDPSLLVQILNEFSTIPIEYIRKNPIATICVVTAYTYLATFTEQSRRLEDHALYFYYTEMLTNFNLTAAFDSLMGSQSEDFAVHIRSLIE